MPDQSVASWPRACFPRSRSAPSSALWTVPGHPLGLALLIGVILAPTDAALGLPVITNPAVPSRIRRILNVESGLNDGIATPFVLLRSRLHRRGAPVGRMDRRCPRELAVGVVVGHPGRGGRWPAAVSPTDGPGRPSLASARALALAVGSLLARADGRRQRVHRGLRRRAGLRRGHPPPRREPAELFTEGRAPPLDRRVDRLRRRVRRLAPRHRVTFGRSPTPSSA